MSQSFMFNHHNGGEAFMFCSFWCYLMKQLCSCKIQRNCCKKNFKCMKCLMNVQKHCSAQIAVVMVLFVVACVGSQMFRGWDFHTIIYKKKELNYTVTNDLFSRHLFNLDTLGSSRGEKCRNENKLGLLSMDSYTIDTEFRNREGFIVR